MVWSLLDKKKKKIEKQMKFGFGRLGDPNFVGFSKSSLEISLSRDTDLKKILNIGSPEIDIITKNMNNF